MMLMKMKHAYSRRARKRRAAIFRRLFPDAMSQSILDLGDFDPTELRALVDRASVYIGGDSGPLHVAATTRTPIVALLGPTLAERSRPWRDPRLVVAGLNPHAGENGTIGAEERDIIAPAVAALAAEGVAVRGPLSADTLFHAAARATYDAALCMYHDQALIPAKTLAFSHAVNVTLGLPFIRTSPDHGTAFDLAGTGRADPSSLVAAVQLAARLACPERA